MARGARRPLIDRGAFRGTRSGVKGKARGFERRSRVEGDVFSKVMCYRLYKRTLYSYKAICGNRHRGC